MWVSRRKALVVLRRLMLLQQERYARLLPDGEDRATCRPEERAQRVTKDLSGWYSHAKDRNDSAEDIIGTSLRGPSLRFQETSLVQAALTS